jgi:hypothetical protein
MIQEILEPNSTNEIIRLIIVTLFGLITRYFEKKKLKENNNGIT